MQVTYERRLTKLRKLLRQAEIPALLVTKFVNVTYLTGFTGDDSYLIVSPEDAIVLSDFRYIDQLQEECPWVSVEIRGQGTSMPELVAQVIGQLKPIAVGVEGETLSVGLFRRLEHALPTTALVVTGTLVEQLREIKDREEIAEIRRSVYLAQRAFGVVRAQLQGAQTETQIAAELEYQIRAFGGSGCSFAPIVAVGPRAALPHAVPTDRCVEASDFVLVDWGAKATRYASDLTRILVTGRISAKLERIYEVVLTAQLRAIEAIRPGARMSDVDAAARDVITEAGFGKQFGHGLGHGIGLEIHEAPRLAVHQDQPLIAGMVVTVEPGIYVPGWGGVRIEDDVLVTRDGHEVLSDLPKELDGCLVR